MGDLLKGEHNNLCVGVDLGTTNSVLATTNEKPNGDVVSKVVEISRGVEMYSAISGEVKLTTQKKPTLPSCIYYRQEKNYEPLVGDFAKMQYPLRPHLVAKSIKSQMGRPLAEGLSPDIQDKTPAQISSRILKHMLREASKVYRCDITDVVITVPANFDSAMCKATRDAAELAGIKVKNADGTERPVLLSEPNAVIYDLINQIRNGEVPSCILDLSEKKRVLVFDLGGGTLDITMHELKRREDNHDVLKVDEIATNRYTLLGGDDFDEEIAQTMYERYLKQFADYPDVVLKLRQEEKVIMPQLRVYAENLKLDLNERCGEDYSSGWDDDDDEIELNIGGNMGGIGYSYDDTFTKEEIEQILSVFMAEDLSYSDYKRLDQITNTRNIIYPILDVLKKASEKIGQEDVKVDAVIVNGGMSKFYMVTDRLKEFFGFDPIVALDPDQAVARGAAVYHYYLHKYEEMQEDMRMFGDSEETSPIKQEDLWEKNTQSNLATATAPKAAMPMMAIQWGSSILNDSLYLGVKNGAVHMIIPTGAELPYTSPVMTGFRVEPGQSMIAIPIKSQNIDGTYRIIANGNISFKDHYVNGAYVAFMIHMGSNKVITMKAWTSRDEGGKDKIEEGYVEISIDNSERSKIKAKFMAPSGSSLQPKAEVNNMLQLCQNYEKCKNKSEKSSIAKRISACVNSICFAGNKEDFSEVILDALTNVTSEEARQRLFTIARKIGTSWSDSERRRLAIVCMSQISADLHGLFKGGPKVSTNIQAIYTLSICANMDQLSKLSAIHDSTRYLQACLYTHAKTRTDLQWLQEEFERDVSQSIKHLGSNLQFSAYAIGIALRKDGNSILSAQAEGRIVKKLCNAILVGNLVSEELTCCILALGWICDQRIHPSEIDKDIIEEALETINSIESYYSASVVMRQERAREVASKMIKGDLLDVEEEQFLLTKLER
ncbi:MAG: Hsp70 family protein [Lachnospiraceae bacterium]|jgi:molecular chaperone DnaK (HSP70)|nr:Hsp70 family protein [Lachnospiraceae bacterium]